MPGFVTDCSAMAPAGEAARATSAPLLDWVQAQQWGDAQAASMPPGPRDVFARTGAPFTVVWEQATLAQHPELQNYAGIPAAAGVCVQEMYTGKWKPYVLYAAVRDVASMDAIGHHEHGHCIDFGFWTLYGVRLSDKPAFVGFCVRGGVANRVEQFANWYSLIRRGQTAGIPGDVLEWYADLFAGRPVG